MKKKLILIFAAGIIFGCLITFKKINITKEIIFNKFDDTRKHKWDKDFKKISIVSSFDSSIQKCYAFSSIKRSPLIVSLHTWSGDYSQNCNIAMLCKKYDIN